MLIIICNTLYYTIISSNDRIKMTVLWFLKLVCQWRINKLVTFCKCGFSFDLNKKLWDRFSFLLAITGFLGKLFNPFSTNVPIMDKQVVRFYYQNVWKTPAEEWPASLLKMPLFHRCFSNILVVKTNYLVPK